MCRFLLHAAIVVLTFALGLLIAPNEPDAGVRGLINRVRSGFQGRTDHRMAAQKVGDFRGRWGTELGPVIEIGDGYIIDTRRGKTYAYTVAKRFDYPNGEDGLLISIAAPDADSQLSRLVYLGSNGGRLDYFGYESWEKYNTGETSISGSYARSF